MQFQKHSMSCFGEKIVTDGWTKGGADSGDFIEPLFA